jgi:pimeloyl-ACP methyl ester carboxylesterase
MKELCGLTASKLFRVFNDFCRNLGLPKELDRVQVPVLIIAGEKESDAMKRSVVDMVNAIPSAKGILVRNGLHTYPWSMHNTFNKIVERYINGNKIDSSSYDYIMLQVK